MCVDLINIFKFLTIASSSKSTLASDCSFSSNSSLSAASESSSLSSSLSTASITRLPMYFDLSHVTTTGDSPGDDAVNSMKDSSEQELNERWRRQLK